MAGGARYVNVSDAVGGPGDEEAAGNAEPISFEGALALSFALLGSGEPIAGISAGLEVAVAATEDAVAVAGKIVFAGSVGKGAGVGMLGRGGPG